MAHFAEVENGIVTRVVVVNNSVITDQSGIEQESIGQQFLTNLLGGSWVQCSYNGNPVNGQDRGVYPGPGCKWDGEKFIFPNISSNDII